MNCPSCQKIELATRECIGLRIDHCPICGGVWLARNQLEWLSERTGLFLKAHPPAGRQPRQLTGLKKSLWRTLFDVGRR